MLLRLLTIAGESRVERLSRQFRISANLVVHVSTAIGIRTKDGIVLAVEKLVQSKLLVPNSNKRIQTVDQHAGIVRQTSRKTAFSFFHAKDLPFVSFYPFLIS